MMKGIKRIFRTLFVATGVVLFWRGMWGLMDLYIHPADPLVSYIMSIVIAVIILSFTRNFFDQLM